MTPFCEQVLRGPTLPPRLTDLPKPPSVLYLRGALPAGPSVAVVGTRTPTAEARDFAEALSAELASSGVFVLSGGAEGIDTAAHQGALNAQGRTVVVAPAGFDRPFPESNAALYRRVVECGGGYISLVSAGVAATRAAFFPRNACLVALAHAVVLVEAPFRSGARNAVACARRLGRPVFVVPAAPWNPRGRGSNAELRRGARLLESAADVLRYLSEARLHPVRLPQTVAEASATGDQASGLPANCAAPVAKAQAAKPLASEALVLAALDSGCATIDAVCIQTGLSVPEVQHSVCRLTLEGKVRLDAPGTLTRTT